MLKCPKCETVYYDDSLKRCLGCRYKLIKTFDSDTNYVKLKSWSYTLMMVIGVIGIALGICCMTIVKSTWQETTSILIIILGALIALFGKHLKEQRRMINLMRDQVVQMALLRKYNADSNETTSNKQKYTGLKTEIETTSKEIEIKTTSKQIEAKNPDRGWICPSCGCTNLFSKSFCHGCAAPNPNSTN